MVIGAASGIGASPQNSVEFTVLEVTVLEFTLQLYDCRQVIAPCLKVSSRFCSMPEFKPKNTPQSVLAALQAGQSLSQQDLYQINLSGLDLQKGDFSQATIIRATLREANFSDANLNEADLRGADLSKALLCRTNLQGACLYRVNLCSADLSDAVLTDAKFQGVQYDSHTIFPEGFAYRSSGAVGPDAHLNGAPLNTANLRNADLQRANLLGAYLGGADLTGANLSGARLVQADLRRAFLTGAFLRKARLNGANLAGIDLRAADLTDVEFEQFESIAGADFSQVQGLSDEMRSRLLKHPAEQLDTLHPLTLKTTRDSLS
jgi:uncharacterized protein YjbI with pentapeptide repeats